MPKTNLVGTHSLADEEHDTYDLQSRVVKETIVNTEIETHWNTRAKRKGVQTVMSARHTLEENLRATQALQEDVLGFLEGYLQGKTIFELGVGIGRMTSVLAEKAEEVVGIDLTEGMLATARLALEKYDNVHLYRGRITDATYPLASYDLVFESIVLLHILDPRELNATVAKMQELSDTICLVEHTYEGPDFPISKYSILRTVHEYRDLFAPYDLIKQKNHLCAGDNFTMMLFKK